ncbi:PAS domain S-box protein [Siccirubricoccus deserti]
MAERTAALREVSDALDLSPSMITDLTGHVVHWSAGCERVYGWTREEMLGKRARTMLKTELPPGGMGPITAALERDGSWQESCGSAARTARRSSPAPTGPTAWTR